MRTVRVEVECPVCGASMDATVEDGYMDYDPQCPCHDSSLVKHVEYFEALQERIWERVDD